MGLIYKRATIEDIDILTETRIEVLRAANKLSDDVDMSEDVEMLPFWNRYGCGIRRSLRLF